ncbi:MULTISPECIES: efflux RND transporter periplasmic adaptor subunit [unclassified Paludibacterium]|uniref:efflux RND transporter periplasmic adaptor subunit n=1 Tax=unclassified Paludibacterium TaxID=2618429 RepID=UPI001C058D60|nr:efflux RND transporter periplasmic adaptor subunit [Paludibacterium sp. B53371]BEV71630.1 efflux RND transporter periplasmic adaptor subunit [Paludibacterium sp. THUN1379]
MTSRYFALGLLTLLSACGRHETTAPPAQTVLVSRIGDANSTQSQVFAASLQARTRSDLAFRVGGTVLRRLVETGQRVHAGQVLAELDPADYRLGLAAARAQWQSIGAEASQAAADQARFTRLQGTGAVAAADAERQRSRASATQAQRQQAESQLALAQRNLDYTQLRAPYDGVITAQHVEAGQVIAAGQPVLSIARPEELEIVADLPETVAAQAARAQASATLWGDQGGPVQLVLRTLAPQASQPARTFEASYRLSRVDAARRAGWTLGQSAELTLHWPQPGTSVLLPAGALLNNHDGPAVWLVNEDGQTIRRQPVVVLNWGSEAVRVQGLQPGQRVVSAGVQKLDARSRIRPVERSGSGLQLDQAGSGS